MGMPAAGIFNKTRRPFIELLQSLVLCMFAFFVCAGFGIIIMNTIHWASFLLLVLMLIQEILFAVQGLFAIVEFENEESAQKVLSHDEDLVLRGRRLVVKPRVTKQTVAAASTDGDDDNGGSVEQSPADLHSQLLSKLTSCSNVCILLLDRRHIFKYCISAIFEIDLSLK